MCNIDDAEHPWNTHSVAPSIVAPGGPPEVRLNVAAMSWCLSGRSETFFVSGHASARCPALFSHYAYPSKLSGGQQQRVAIAPALAMSPKLMLFDEARSSGAPAR